ncbi:MAG TPA: hypothetical protein VK465_00970, partial [Fibrobacteria bacterium]|nr:hypothetical protein [Fibrobacteria bacterium]
VIRAYDDHHTDIFRNAKVAFHYDDGRRWLNRNPDRTFDFIMMNTTFHWRSNITNLVSEEFLHLTKRHLKPGGVIYFNTTHSDDITYTAARAFKHVTQFGTFVAAGDSPFTVHGPARRENFLRFLDKGKPVFSQAVPESRAVLDSLVNAALPELSDSLLARKDLRLITDDNMLTEFKKITDSDAIGFLYRIYNPDLSWPALAAAKRPN